MEQVIRFLWVGVVGLVLTACGGGGNDNGGNGGGGTTTPTDLFYMLDSLGLKAVDPDSPTSPTEVEPAMSLLPGDFDTLAVINRVYAATPDSGMLRDIHLHAIIYPNADGYLYKVSALKSGTLSPVRVSSETMANQLCTSSSIVSMDFATADDSQYVYALPGMDATCDTDDDVWKMVRLGMSASEAPISAKPVVGEIMDSSSGVLAGWLVHDKAASELQRCDAGFANCTTLAPVSSFVSSLDFQSGCVPAFLVEIDSQVYVYTVATNTLSQPLFDASGSSVFDAYQDGVNFYIASSSMSGSWILQVPIDGSAAATTVATETDWIDELYIANSTLVYSVSDNAGGTSLKSVAKTGGTPMTLATASGTDELEIYYVGDKLMYYNIQGTSSLAGVIESSGANPVEITDAAWAGLNTANQWPMNGLFYPDLVKTLILAEADTSGAGFAGATIKSVDASTSADVAILGTLPDTDPISAIDCFSIGANALCGVEITLNSMTTPTTQSDIFYLNADVAGSLQRVTATAETEEVW